MDVSVPILFNRFTHWGKRIVFGVLDQAVFSISNFIVSFVLARWLSTQGYGVFSIAFSLFLFISGFVNSLIWEPMTVYGTTRHKYEVTQYLQKQLWLQLGLTFFLGVLLFVFSALLGEDIRLTFLVGSLCLPFILLIWFFRQSCYVLGKSNLAFFSSLVYALVYLAFLSLIKQYGYLSEWSAFIGMAIASSIAALFAKYLTKIPLLSQANGNKALVLLENWQYGRYILAATIASGVANLLYIPMIGLILGLPQAAAYRAMQNFILPAQQMTTAVNLILLPQLSRVRHTQGEQKAQNTFQLGLAVVLVFTICYSFAVSFFGPKLVQLLYKNPYYDQFSWLLGLLSILLLVMTVGQLFGTWIRVQQRPQAIFWAKASSAVAVMSIGLFSIWQWKMTGVIVSSALGSLVEAIIFVYFSVKLVKKQSDQP